MAEDEELLKKYNSIYLSVIMRYKDYIEEHEGLYVAELPKLVTPEDSSVVSVASIIKSGFQMYLYERDFLQAARLAYAHVKDKITIVNLPIQFWQRPAETLANNAGDLFDTAVLLCSILIALGGVSTKILIAIREGERDFIIYSEYKDELLTVDLEKGVSKAKSREELIARLKIDKDSDVSAYEFNDKMYADVV